ncbi:hypothetical protein Dimus_010345 [Dionaea muscipula]
MKVGGREGWLVVVAWLVVCVMGDDCRSFSPLGGVVGTAPLSHLSPFSLVDTCKRDCFILMSVEHWLTYVLVEEVAGKVVLVIGASSVIGEDLKQGT